MRNPVTFIFSVVFLHSAFARGPVAAAPAADDDDTQRNVNELWCADNGDGTYRNPVIYADYSDPDVIRVGDLFYLVASSFNKVPGLPLLTSSDLVNWKIAGYALSRMEPESEWTGARPGDGVWAPSIRYHEGRFVIYYPDYPFGIRMVSAADIGGPWTDPVVVDPNPGAIDPCPFWDDDGTGWIVMGWAKSIAGVNNRISLKRLGSDGTVVPEDRQGFGTIIIDGNKLPPVHTSIGDRTWNTLEGPKLYKRGGWYYVFAPAGSVKPGFQAVFRSRTIAGPYEVRNVLDQGDTDINGPHQGAWVTTAAGKDCFIHFQDRDTYGRVVMLEPMRWKKDWPLIGTSQDAYGLGKPVTGGKKPVPGKNSVTRAASGKIVENFEGKIGPAWQWTGNPAAGSYDLTAVPGALSLKAVPGTGIPFYDAGSLTRKFPAPDFTATVHMNVRFSETGATAGLTVIGNNSGWITSVRNADGTIALRAVTQLSANNNGRPVVTGSVPSVPAAVWLRVNVTQKIILFNKPYTPPFWKAWIRDEQAMASFSYSLDGVSWIPLGEPFQTDKGRWVGAQVGIFAVAPAGTPADTTASGGWADFDRFILE
jgi:beta-xylosidase